MMKVKLLSSIASADYSYAPGEVVDLDEGKALCEAGLAVPVKTTRKKKAVKRGKETAALE
ncbi:MAG: hypothetical protein HKM98_00565 [Gammaproteobacteria bacterium]|nr:hypothetical protein [Gammaproteobacteria bacterium]